MSFENELKKAMAAYGDAGLVEPAPREYIHKSNLPEKRCDSSEKRCNESMSNAIRRYRTVAPMKKIADMNIFKKL